MLAKSLRSSGAAVCIAAVLLTGCGESKYLIVPVAGVVTLNGEPLPEASLVFSPQGSPENPYPGPRSTATTDVEGRFRLHTVEGSDGAVVGRHHVSLTTGKSRVDPENPLRILPSVPERVPMAYRMGGRLDTDVPEAGLPDLRFELQSAP